MATEKKITSRIQQKHDVAANWAKATNFIPKKGELIIYDAEYNASGEETQAVRIKIGDGSKTVNNLPFAVIDYSSDIETLEQKVVNNSTAIGALQENTVPKTRKINNKALSSDITLGAADVGVNETTFPGLKKTGTVTGVKINGTTKNPSSGVVDLGTVLTDASKFATAAQGSNADNALSKANTNAGEISKIKDGTTKVKKAEHADTTDNATNVTTNINGKAISSIFETNGTTAKEATHAGKATSADKATQSDSASKVANNLTFSGQNAQGTESTIGFDGSQAQEVAFNGDDFVATKGSAFEVSIAPSGVTAGTYNNVTVDEKGRVTGGENKSYGTYSKPTNGIPKSDLSTDVQASLDKADNAVQSFEAEATIDDTTGIPTVEVAKSGEGTAPTYTFNFKHLKGTDGQQGEAGLMYLGIWTGEFTTSARYYSPINTFNRTPKIDETFIMFSNKNQYALMQVLSVSNGQVKSSIYNLSDLFIVSTKGQDGVSVTNAIAGTSTVADGKTTTPITFNLSDGTTKEVNVEAQNGTDGAQGIGVKSITSGTPTVVNDKTNTPITITLTDNTTVDLVVSAENGKDGTSATVDIAQTTGTSTSSVMSQNATTNAISGKLDKTKYEVNKTINFGRDGALYVGKFKVYDTNVTFEITSTTSVTYSGKLVIATQNYVIREAKVYGDAANTVTPNIYIKPSTTSDPYIEVYFKPESWSKNVIHIYGSEIKAEPTDVCTNVPAVPSTATSKPTNALDRKANLSDLPIKSASLSGTTLYLTL